MLNLQPLGPQPLSPRNEAIAQCSPAGPLVSRRSLEADREGDHRKGQGMDNYLGGGGYSLAEKARRILVELAQALERSSERSPL